MCLWLTLAPLSALFGGGCGGIVGAILFIISFIAWLGKDGSGKTDDE
jgi:hypothetical protein